MSMIFVIAIIVILYLVASANYKKTDYYTATKRPLLSILFNKGYYGEYMIYFFLKAYETVGAKFLYNCYLPKDRGQTTEVDLIMIHQSGIYVFESKNYGGWIFGSEYSKTWTQTLPGGHEARKEHFLNPIMQNKLHIKWLKKQIGENYPIHSIIVFSDRCSFKKVDVNSNDVFVIKRNSIFNTVKNIAGRTGVTMSQNQVEAIYTKLYPFTQVSEDVKLKHIADIYEEQSKEYSNTKEPIPSTAMSTDGSRVCPKCGGNLVLRVSKKGAYAGNQFYGCSNFPKCRYTKY